MKSSNNDFLEKISKKALEKANRVDTEEPKPKKKLKLKKPKPYPLPKEGLIIPKKIFKQSSPKSYPIEQEVIRQE